MGTAPTQSILGNLAIVVCVIAVVTLLVGHVLGVPILLSYVESGSMEPSIDEGDGFIAIPTGPTSDIDTGDVVVFEAKDIDDGGLTTHRVVAETENGYVTQGDANPVTDQDSGEPYVTDGQVVATAWQVNGHVVTIPYLGTTAMGVESGLETIQWRLASVLGTTAVLGTQGLAYLLIVAGLVIAGASLVFDRHTDRKRTRERSRSRQDMFDTRTLVLSFAALVCIVTFATMVAMSGPTEIGIVSADFDSERPTVIETGETEIQTWEIGYTGVIPVVTLVEPASQGIEVEGGDATLLPGESINASVALTAPGETGYYLRTFSEYRYFAVLPSPFIHSLHAIHPWVAMAAVTGVMGALFTLPFALALGTGSVRTQTHERDNRARTRQRPIHSNKKG